ncbi:early nodulin-like protein 17 [Salvia miltiorrhiza]|uniref:early nodulin-like protein 17 n=1 Tax=Salvia miltiorrhiza TaxID=226208 RepID=UPI0025AD1B3A|nr:early nodulin-like protein 17 [Salvia miltiorrhiza]
MLPLQFNRKKLINIANSKMASFMGFRFTTLFLLIITASAPVAITADEFKVGGDEGWRQPASNETDMYRKWAETLRFHVEDSLRFVYKNDSVMVVEKFGYYHCNSTNPASVFKDGNTVINLERPGPAYFASGDPDHCKNGQRLMVEVVTLHPVSRSSPPAPSPSGAGSSSVVPQLLLFYLLVAASIHV